MERNLMVAGFGGQGVMTLGKFLAEATCESTDKNVTFFPSYGAEQNGLVASLNSTAKLPYHWALDGISNTVLASALRELERDGLVTRREYLEVPVRVEYGPTDSCRALLPILEQLSDWAEARM